MNINNDYYAILELSPLATREEIREAYRRLAKLHHPDKNPDNPEAEEQFKCINEAYEVLRNEVKRHVYDTERKTKPFRQTELKEKENVFAESYANNPHRPERKTTERKHYVNLEKRIYVFGNLKIKFQADPDLEFHQNSPLEQQYTIYPTECLAVIEESDLYFNGTSKSYENTYSAMDLFKTPIPQPMETCVKTAEGDKYYSLYINEIRIADPVIIDVVKYDKTSYGTLEGKLYGFIQDYQTEEITETCTEFCGKTGNIDIKEEGNAVYMRTQYYAADGSTYWSDWILNSRQPSKRSYRHDRKTDTSRHENTLGNWWWLIITVLLVAFFPKLLLIIGPLIGIYLMLALLVLFIEYFYKALPWIGGLLFLLLVGAGLFSHHHSSFTPRTKPVKSKFDSTSSSKTIIPNDTLIKHFIRWQDRDSTCYSIQLSIPASEVTAAIHRHNQMDFSAYNDIKEVYTNLLSPEHPYLQAVAFSFDSIARINHLDQLHKASMVVSCIQSLPYTLILDRACTDSYTDPFVNDYLRNCHDDCCKEFVKFGVQSPAEFMQDLKGDCDTKSLFLYEVLHKLGYKVALLTSEYYKHALIAVQLPQLNAPSKINFNANGKNYFLWETTSAGFGPGELPVSKSELRYWNITLIQ